MNPVIFTLLLGAAVTCPSAAAAQQAAPSPAPVTTSSQSTMTSATIGKKNDAQPTDDIKPSKLDRELLSKLVFDRINQIRREHDLSPVERSKPLHRLARRHSRDMARRSYFSHSTKREGQQQEVAFGERVSLEELDFRRTGENIALQPIVQSSRTTITRGPSGEVSREVEREIVTYEELARNTVEGWMNSPGHRKNILTPEFNRMGLGFAVGQRDGTPYVYITQDFGQE